MSFRRFICKVEGKEHVDVRKAKEPREGQRSVDDECIIRARAALAEYADMARRVEHEAEVQRAIAMGLHIDTASGAIGCGDPQQGEFNTSSEQQEGVRSSLGGYRVEYTSDDSGDLYWIDDDGDLCRQAYTTQSRTQPEGPYLSRSTRYPIQRADRLVRSEASEESRGVQGVRSVREGSINRTEGSD